MRKIAIVVLFVAVGAFAQKWTPEASVRIRTISGVNVSPDGSRVAFAVADPVMTDEKSEYVRQVWLAKSDGSDASQLTFGEKSSYAPEWLPDNSGIVFLSDRSGKPQIYVLRLRGGEAEPITSGKIAPSAIAVSPDGKLVAFTASDVVEEQEKKAKAKEDYRWVDEDLKPSRLYVVAIAKDSDGKREPRKLVSGDFHVTDPAWSPDSASIAFTKTKSSGTNDWPTADVAAVDLASGNVRNIAATSDSEGTALYSHDGKWIAITVADATWATRSHVQLVRADGSAKKDLASTYDVQPEIVGFSPDDSRLYVREFRGTGDRLYTIDVAANKVAGYATGNEVLGPVSINATGTYFGMAKQSFEKPVEVFVARADHFAPVQVSHLNDEFAKYPLPRSEVIRWKNPNDNLEVEGLLTYPIGYQTGHHVPLLLVIHGGPTGVFTQTFTGNWSPFPVAAFAERGYAVLRANPRGSSGYGEKFRYANYNDWGGADYADLMAGVDRVISLGVADPARLGVMGWSYGGFMTSWVITHTPRFKAATVGAGVTDLVSFTGTSDINGFLPDYFGGPFWDRMDAWRTHSPITFVKGVTTPTLIEHGEADERVPITQGYELYDALKTQKVPVRMLVLPRQHHGPSEPKMRMEAAQANLDWFAKWIPATAK